jgi:hypothetical protein
MLLVLGRNGAEKLHRLIGGLLAPAPVTKWLRWPISYDAKYMYHCTRNVYAKLWRDRGTCARPAGDLCQFGEFEKVRRVCTCLFWESAL